MATVEVSGKTLEEARQRAAQELGCGEDEMTVEMIDEPRRFLGIIGGAEYRIRATFGETQETGVADALPAQAAPAADEAAAVAGDPGQESVPQSVARRAHDALEQITSFMGIEADVAIQQVNADEVCLDITGEDASRLIGRHGATLDALQLLVAAIANRGLVRGARVVLDAEGYRAKREEMLREMAITHATRAKEANKEIVIRDLKPYERRIIHMALVDDPDVETYSEGDDDDRQLVISPRT